MQLFNMKLKHALNSSSHLCSYATIISFFNNYLVKVICGELNMAANVKDSTLIIMQ